jgi:hypothetical protein
MWSNRPAPVPAVRGTRYAVRALRTSAARTARALAWHEEQSPLSHGSATRFENRALRFVCRQVAFMDASLTRTRESVKGYKGSNPEELPTVSRRECEGRKQFLRDRKGRVGKVQIPEDSSLGNRKYGSIRARISGNGYFRPGPCKEFGTVDVLRCSASRAAQKRVQIPSDPLTAHRDLCSISNRPAILKPISALWVSKSLSQKLRNNAKIIENNVGK